jgi:hypothetical protein
VTEATFECGECGLPLELVDGKWMANDTDVCKVITSLFDRDGKMVGTPGAGEGEPVEQPHAPVPASVSGKIRDIDAGTTALNPDGELVDVLDHSDVEEAVSQREAQGG